MADQESPADRLRVWRTLKRITLAQAGETLQTSAQILSRVERGDQAPGLSLAACIEDEVGIPCRDWMPPATTDTGTHPAAPTGDDR